MKRKLALVLLLCLICSITAQADSIWEPPNDFFKEHQDECKYVRRQYLVNSPKGGAYLYSAPGSDKVVDALQNGSKLSSYALYEDGVWVLTYGTSGTYGWFRAEDAVVDYDGISFQEEYAESFYQDDTLVEEMLDNLQRGKYVRYYEYPGAAIHQFFFGTDLILDNLEEFSIKHLFQDENALIWGYVGTFMDVSRGWICVSDPLNHDLPIIDRQTEIELYPSWEEQGVDPMESIKTEKRNEVALVATMVAGVAVVSLVQILVIRKKKKQKAAD